MKVNIRVTFDMSFDDANGECKTQVAFALPDHPKMAFPESIRSIVIGEIRMLCGAMGAVPDFIDTPTVKTAP